MQETSLTTAIIFALIFVISSGITTGIQKQVVPIIGSSKMIVYRGITLSIGLLILALLFNNKQTIDPGQLLLAVLLCAISYFGLYFFGKALETVKSGVVQTIASGRVILVTIFSALFLGEVLLPVHYLLLVVILLGVALLCLDFRNLKDIELKNKGVKYAIFAALIWGITFPLFGVFTNRLGNFFFPFVLEFTVCLTGIAQTKINHESVSLNKVEYKQIGLLLLGLGIVGILQSLGLNLSLATGHYSIASAIHSTSPLAVAIYGRLILKEHLTKQQLLGMFIVVLSVLLVTIS